VPTTSRSLFLATVWLLIALASAQAEETRPVWLVSNGFHTSLGVRTRDVPEWRGLSPDAKADVLLIGWGASSVYHGKLTSWRLGAAAISAKSVLHVVGVRGLPARRFTRSDVVRLRLTKTQFALFVKEVDAAFARDKAGRRVVLGRGFFAESQFYAGSERFYFPNTCNVWLAAKLRRAGLPVSPSRALLASGLIWEGTRFGVREGKLGSPWEGF
jgi:uncharacterized protein (TIGR02117 family)